VTTKQFQPVFSKQTPDSFFRREVQGPGSSSSPFQINIASSAIDQAGLRENMLSNLSRARVTVAPVFNTLPAGAIRESFNIQNHYSMPPEDVKPILNQLKKEVDNTDFSGMSNKQVYNWIESKFIEAFGEDFMMGYNLLQIIPGSGALNNPDSPVTNHEFVKIGSSFNELVSGKIGFGEMQKINREQLFGNKSDMEIVDAIIAKHPQRLTNRSIALILSEIDSVGIRASIGFDTYVNELLEKSGGNTLSDWSDYEEVWNSLLNRPANVQELAFPLNMALERDGKNPNVLRAKDILVKMGAELGPNGYFLDPDGNPFVELGVTFGSLDSDDLFDEFHNDLEKHDENLREARELLEKNSSLKVYDDSSEYKEIVGNYEAFNTSI